jgi:hypothetical protein
MPLPTNRTTSDTPAEHVDDHNTLHGFYNTHPTDPSAHPQYIPKSIVDAKGDIIAASADDIVDRLAVGANGQVLTADSVAALGIKWATPSTPAGTPFAVVAPSGGDYTSIRTAIQAQTANAIIFVKPGTYNDTGAGRVTVPAGLDIIVWATPSFAEVPNNTSGDQLQPTHQSWTYDGLTASAGSQTWLTLIGIDANSGSAQVVANMGASTRYRLAIQNGQITSTGNLYGTYNAVGDLGFSFSDSEIQAQFCNTVPFTLAVLFAYRTHFTNFHSGTTSHTFAHSMTGGTDNTAWDIRMVDCRFSVGTLTWAGDTGSALGFASFEGCTITGTSWTFRDNGPISFVGCHGDNNASIGAITVDNVSAAGQALGFQMYNCDMVSTVVTDSGDEVCPTIITGVFSRLVLSRTADYGALCDVQLTSGNGTTPLTVSGNQNHVDAVLAGSTTGTVTVTISGNDNYVNYRTGHTVTLTDTGSRNTIIPGQWLPWTPTLTNITAGNGSVVARYKRIGRSIHYAFRFTLGSTSSISGDPQFTLPAAPETTFINAANAPLGRGHILDAGTELYDASVHFISGSTVSVRAWATGGTYSTQAVLSATEPFTWTTGDTIWVSGTYEAVS